MANLNNQKKIVEPMLNGKDLNIEKGNLKPERVGMIEDIKPTDQVVGIKGDFVKKTSKRINLSWKSEKLSPVLDIVDSKKAVLTFGNKFDISAIVDKGISILEYGSNISEFNEMLKTEALTRDDIRDLLGGMREYNDKVMEQLLAQEVEKWVRENGTLRVPKASGFEVSVNTQGPGVVCSYSSWINDPGHMLSGARNANTSFTYKLTRMDLGLSSGRRVIGDNIRNNSEIDRVYSKLLPITIVDQSEKSVFALNVIDTNVQEGQSYRYTLTVKYKSSGDSETFTKDIAYAPNPPVIDEFSAYPHSTEAKVVFTVKVKNAVSKEIKRSDLTTSLGDVAFDANVKAGGKYQYTLIATNYWDSVRKVINVSCSDVLPRNSVIAARVSDIEKKVTLTWQSNNRVASYTVQRKKKGVSTWNSVCTEAFKNLSCTIEDKDSSLVKGNTYEYRVVNKNGWGEASSNVVEVLFDKPTPKNPRIAWTQYDTSVYFKWDYQANVNKYDLIRMNDGGTLNANTYLCTATDNSRAYGMQYTYKITAKNEWGESLPTYCLVKLENPDISANQLLDCYKLIGKSIDEEETAWSEDFQGVTLDGTYWYFTSGSEYAKLLKYPINDSITSSIKVDKEIAQNDCGIKYNIGYVSNNARTFYCKNFHFGDCAWYDKYLFIPAYPSGDDDEIKEIWIIDARTFRLLHKEEIKKKDNVRFSSLGWCAINPCDRKLYTSDHTLENEYTEKGSPLIRFKINFENIGTSKPVFERDGEIKVYRQNGVAMNGKESMQGGCFDYYNNIYLNSGYLDCARAMEGIQVFKLVRDDSKQFNKAVEEAAYYKWLNKGQPQQNAVDQKRDYQEAYVDIAEAYNSRDLNLEFDCTRAVMFSMSDNDNYPFKYNVAHGLPIFGTSIYAEEPEGLAYYDLTQKSTLPSDYMRCSLHAGLLDNELTDDDEVYMMEYQHLFRETGCRTIHYHPSNLAVKEDENRNDYKLVDNCILVQRFTDEQEATRARDLFTEWGRGSNGEFNYHVIGDLYTCSPEHNYEFKIWNGAPMVSSESAYLFFEYNKNGCSEPVYECERWVVTVKSKDGKKRKTFYAHNEGDAYTIWNYIKDHSKMYMIGSSTINDERNFIWFR